MLDKLPSGRPWDDVKVTEIKTTTGKFLIFKLHDAWRLVFKSNDAKYYDLVTNGRSFAEVYDIARAYRINQMKCVVNKLKGMLKDV